MPAESQWQNSLTKFVLTLVRKSIPLLIMLGLSSAIAQAIDKPHVFPDWIRVRAKFANDRQSTVWYSPNQQIWVRSSGNDATTFCDGVARKRYVASRDGKSVHVWPLGEENPDPVFPASQLTPENRFLGGWFFRLERIVDQRQVEVMDDGKTWTEIHFGMFSGQFYNGILRVNPVTRQPLFLLIAVPGSKDSPTRWDFDYPNEGPEDVRLLALQKGVSLINHCPSEEALKALEAIASSRRKVGDFKMVVADREFPLANKDDVDPPLNSMKIVYRKGDQWRVDLCDIPDSFWTKSPGIQFSDLLVWLTKHPDDFISKHTFISDGNSVFQCQCGKTENPEKPEWRFSKNISPLALTMPHWSDVLLPYEVRFAAVLYPDLTIDNSQMIDVDPKLMDALGCVVIKQSNAIATNNPKVAVCHWQKYFDVSKGHLLVKSKTYYLPKGEKPDAESVPDQTIETDGLQKSPQGWWYPSIVKHTNRIGDDTQYNYQFDFDVELPDSLFSIDPATKSVMP